MRFPAVCGIPWRRGPPGMRASDTLPRPRWPGQATLFRRGPEVTRCLCRCPVRQCIRRFASLAKMAKMRFWQPSKRWREMPLGSGSRFRGWDTPSISKMPHPVCGKGSSRPRRRSAFTLDAWESYARWPPRDSRSACNCSAARESGGPAHPGPGSCCCGMVVSSSIRKRNH